MRRLALRDLLSAETATRDRLSRNKTTGQDMTFDAAIAPTRPRRFFIFDMATADNKPPAKPAPKKIESFHVPKIAQTYKSSMASACERMSF
jgi:hypothetical protein